jgi:hypothetical protein
VPAHGQCAKKRLKRARQTNPMVPSVTVTDNPIAERLAA